LKKVLNFSFLTYSEDLSNWKFKFHLDDELIEIEEEDPKYQLLDEINFIKSLKSENSLFSEKTLTNISKSELKILEENIILSDSSFSIDNLREIPVPFVYEEKSKSFEEVKLKLISNILQIKSTIFFELNFNELPTSKFEILLPSFWYSNEMYKARKVVNDLEFKIKEPLIPRKSIFNSIRLSNKIHKRRDSRNPRRIIRIERFS
jgi:hypothetical protein